MPAHNITTSRVNKRQRRLAPSLAEPTYYCGQLRTLSRASPNRRLIQQRTLTLLDKVLHSRPLSEVLQLETIYQVGKDGGVYLTPSDFSRSFILGAPFNLSPQLRPAAAELGKSVKIRTPSPKRGLRSTTVEKTKLSVNSCRKRTDAALDKKLEALGGEGADQGRWFQFNRRYAECLAIEALIPSSRRAFYG